MPTQIIDGFRLNAATPIDSRLVTTGTASRNLMAYKYNGLRVYDTVQKTSFVYIDDVWKEDSGTTILSPSGSGTGMNLGGNENFIPKITSYGTTNSIIREYTATGGERKIGINVPSTTTIAKTLHVVGNSQFDGQINATQFVGPISGLNVQYPVNLDKLSTPGDTKTYVLKSINNSNKWVEETTGSKIIVTNTINEENLLLVLSKDPSTDTTGAGNQLYVNRNTTSDLLAVNTKTRQLMVSSNNEIDKPQYSFVGILNTGMYGSSTEIGLSMAGSKRVYVTSNMVGINIAQTNTVKFESALTTINTATEISGTNTFKVGGSTTLNDTLTVATDKATTLGGTLTIASGKATTLGGTLTVTGASTLNDTLTVASGKATTLGGTLTVNGNTFTVGTGATTLGGTLAVTGATTLSSTLTISNNTSPGIKITSSGEFLRSIQSSGNFNYMSFYKTDTATPSAANGRRGYIGYGSSDNDSFIIANETTSSTGNIVLYTKSIERVNISNSNTTIKTPLIVESNVASAVDSGLIIKDTSANRGAFWMTPYLDVGQYNTTVVQADFGLIFSSNGYNTKNGSNGFAIVPHSDTAGGIRIDDTGRLEAHGGLTIGKKTSTSSHNGTIMQRIVVGSVNVARLGNHVINKGASFIEFGVGSTSDAISPVAVLKFKNAMPSTNYSVFVSFSHNVDATLWTCSAEVIDVSNFKISVRRTNESQWSGVLEVSFMAICYDN